MFTIKAVLPGDTTDIYETGQLTINKKEQSIEFHNPMWDQQVMLSVGPDTYSCIFIENQHGKTVEALRYFRKN